MITFLLTILALLLLGVCIVEYRRARQPRWDEAALLAQLTQMEADIDRADRDYESERRDFARTLRPPRTKTSKPSKKPPTPHTDESARALSLARSHSSQVPARREPLTSDPKPIVTATDIEQPSNSVSNRLAANCFLTLPKLAAIFTPAKWLVRAVSIFVRAITGFLLRRTPKPIHREGSSPSPPIHRAA